MWRSGRDSNPRYAFGVYSLSRRAPSTTRPPLRKSLEGGHLGKSLPAGNLAGPRLSPLCARTMRSFATAPSADEIEAIARRALEALPQPFAASLGDIVLLIQDFADEATLHDMGIEDPFELTGIYEGVPLTERSVEQSG